VKIEVLNKTGEKVKDLTLNPVFETKVSSKTLTLYVNYLRNATRGAVAKAKDRAEVSGGGKKPWKQKGTGRARAGSSRSPLWVGGGVTFGPKQDRTFGIKVNKNIRRQAILSIFSDLIRDKKARIIDDLSFAEIKTKEAANVLDSIKAAGKIALILTDPDQNAQESFRNIAGVNLMMPNKVNAISLATSDNLVMSEKTLEALTINFTEKVKE